jgi:predicted GNAT family N-acyltransferase
VRLYSVFTEWWVSAMTISTYAVKLLELDRELAKVNANLNHLGRVIVNEYERKEQLERMVKECLHLAQNQQQ